MNDLIAHIRQTVRDDSDTQWFDVETADQIAYVESVIDIELPNLLKRCYTEISNGCFGPAYGITGLPGGYESSWGDFDSNRRGVAQARRLRGRLVAFDRLRLRSNAVR